MSPGPAKSFDPEIALVRARDLFWSRGYDGTGIRDLEAELGVNRKSLYDTFGSKRALFLRALEQYTDSVIAHICKGLADERGTAFENLERVLGKLQAHHASPESRGCLLGVAMGQAEADDEELAECLRGYLAKLERAFERALKAAQAEGSVRADVNPRDSARQLAVLTQGMALVGRVNDSRALQRSIVRASLDLLRA